MEEAFFRDMQERQDNLTDEQKERVRELAKDKGINEDLHLLLLGRPGVGKSTFAGELTGGIFKGSSGPSGGTKSSDVPGQWRHIKMRKMEEEISTKTDGSNTKKAYFVYDTVGLGDVKVDLNEMKREAKEVCEQNKHCAVFLCIGWEDRIDSRDTQIAFDVCDSLGMWDKVIVVVTKCDSTSQESDPNSEEFIRIKGMERDWKESIANKLKSMNVEDLEIAKMTENMVFYPNNKIKPADQESCLTWAKTLMQRLKDIIQYEKETDNAVPALSYGISIMLNFIFRTIERFSALSCIQLSGDDQVQEVDGGNQNIDCSCATSMPIEDEQLHVHEKKGLSEKAKGGIVGGAIATGVIGVGAAAAVLIRAFAIEGKAAIIGGVAIGAATGGIGGVVGALIVGLIAYFYFKDKRTLAVDM